MNKIYDDHGILLYLIHCSLKTCLLFNANITAKKKKKLPNSNQLILIIVHQPFSSNNQATIEMIPQIKIIPESIAGIYQYLKKCILFNHSKLEFHLLVAGKRL